MLLKGSIRIQGLIFLALLLSACFDNAETATQGQSEEIKTLSAQAKVHDPHLAKGSSITAKNASVGQGMAGSESEQKPDPAAYTNKTLTVLDVSERSYDGGNALSVTLSIPLDPSRNFDGYFVLSEEGVGVVDGDPVISANGKIVYFPFTKPSTTYQLTVYKGLKGIAGKPLQTHKRKKVKTREILATYNFASKGAFLSLKQHSGLPVVVVNTPEVNVDFFRINNDSVAQYLNGYSHFKDTVYRYATKNALKGASLVYSARYAFDAPKNRRREFNLPVQSIDELAEPGVYVAVMSTPGDYYSSVKMSYFTVTDIGMHVRVYDQQIEAFVSNLAEHQSLAGVDVEVIDRKGNVIYATKTSPDGVASIPRLLEKARYIVARSQDSYSMVPLTGAALDLSDFKLPSRPYQAQELFIYSPRDLYRPGEIIDFNALIRDFDGHLVKAPALKVKIRQPGGHTATSFTWRSEKAGFYSYTYQIPPQAKTGVWKLEVKNAGSGTAVYSFKVEEFLPERMKLTYNQGIAKKVYAANDKLAVAVLGEYLYGAPASENRFEPRIKIRPNRQPFPQHEKFEFGDSTEELRSSGYNLPDVSLDKDGKALIKLKNTWQQIKSPIEVSLLGSLFESGGRPVSRIHSMTVLPEFDLLGIRPHFSDNPSENSRVSFDIISTNHQGELLSKDDIDVSLVRQDRKYFWEYSESRGWHYQWTDSEYIETALTIATTANKPSKVELPVEYGHYRLEVKDKYSGAVSTYSFFAGYDWYQGWKNNQDGEQAAKPDVVSLAWDKKAYKAGDTAILSIVPPKAGEAILLVESDKPLMMRRLSLPAGSSEIAIPIEQDWDRHDIYASVVHLQPGEKVASITPTRSMGLIHLPLDREARRLELALDIDEKITPNQDYAVKVKVDGNGQLPAYITVSMVDVGVLSLTDFVTPDPHKFFFEPRRYSVDSRDMYQKLIALNNNKLAKQKFGGDAELSRGGKQAQSEVQILSLFSGLVAVDQQGYAKINFTIPDFNGRVRLMVTAFTEQQYASTEQEMTIAAPVVTQLAMPRFLAAGDHSTLALDIHNLTEQPQDLRVQMTASAPLSLANTQQLRLAPQEKTTIRYPVSAQQETGTAQISLQVSGIADYQIDRNWQLNVRSAYPAVTQQQRKVLEKGAAFDFHPDETKALIPTSLEALLSVNNRVNLNLSKHMSYLLHYPYGCLEQSTSAAYPWLFANQETLDAVGIANNQALSKRNASITEGLQRIQAKSLTSGGYGLWGNTSPEEHWLTAYVADFLTDARALGVAVENHSYKRTMQRLHDYLTGRNSSYGNRWSQAKEHYDVAYRAYAGYVLSRHKKARLSSLRSLAKNKIKQAKSPLPLVHLGLALHNQGDRSAGLTIIQQAKRLSRSSGYLGDYGSPIRDKAMIIRLLLEHNIETKFAAELAQQLVGLIKARRYLSTQERNALFLAGISLSKHNDDQWQALLAVNQQTRPIQRTSAYVEKFDAATLADGLRIQNEGDAPLFVDFSYQGIAKVAPQPVSNGVSIEREYLNSKGEAVSVDKLAIGELVLVSLKVTADKRHPDALVVDLLPAGLELENQNLQHAIKLDDIKVAGKHIKSWLEKTKVIHQEFRDDRYVAAIDLSNYRSAYLIYLARAVTPGKYQVPAPFVEDMYQPEINSIGSTPDSIEVVLP